MLAHLKKSFPLIRTQASANQTPRTNNLKHTTISWNSSALKKCLKSPSRIFAAFLFFTADSAAILDVQKNLGSAKKSWICKKIPDLPKNLGSATKISDLQKNLGSAKNSQFCNRAQYIRFKLNIFKFVEKSSKVPRVWSLKCIFNMRQGNCWPRNEQRICRTQGQDHKKVWFELQEAEIPRES